MSISSFISTVGENPKFIAFMAHSGVACSVILATHGNLWVVLGAFVTALVKEFWFDLRYEKTPPQTLADSALDFAGYTAGILAGLLLSL